MARRPAAEPSIRLLTIFMLTSSCGKVPAPPGANTQRFWSPDPLKTAQSFRVFGHTRVTRGTKANHLTGRSGPQSPQELCMRCSVKKNSLLAHASVYAYGVSSAQQPLRANGYEDCSRLLI